MPLLQQIRLENLLSFGPETGALELRPLNVLIGPNGVGKSNLIEAIRFLKASTESFEDTVRTAGGIRTWIWNRATIVDYPLIEVVVGQHSKLVHQIQFCEESHRFRLHNERIATLRSTDRICQSDSYEARNELFNFDIGWFVYDYRNGDPVLMDREGNETKLTMKMHLERSAVALFHDPYHQPEIASLSDAYDGIRIYREWIFGRNNPARLPQRADGRTDYLESDCSNLGMILNRIRRDPVQKAQLLECLNDLYPDIRDVDVSIEGGSVQVFLVEGTHAIPATRLSDGTLRYLCLLAILLHPTPPPLICIEEPELGLHPDVMPAMARLLKQASERTQLIVTTHSEVLVDALGDTPEDVVVCEKHDGCTTFNRLDGEKLKVWLKDYSLGMLWRKGEIGGNRW